MIVPLCTTDISNPKRTEDEKFQGGSISWSQKNMLCVSGTCMRGTERLNRLFLMDPNQPQKYTVVDTGHRNTVRIQDWGPLTCSNHLLTADDQDNITVWKNTKNNCVNDISIAKEFQMEGVICAKWIQSSRKVRICVGLLTNSLFLVAHHKIIQKSFHYRTQT
jgi:hypothetical protein